jgi:hypothetical protein
MLQFLITDAATHLLVFRNELLKGGVYNVVIIARCLGCGMVLQLGRPAFLSGLC